MSERDPSVSAADSIHNTTRGKHGVMTLGRVGVRYRSPPSLQRRFDRRQASGAAGCARQPDCRDDAPSLLRKTDSAVRGEVFQPVSCAALAVNAPFGATPLRGTGVVVTGRSGPAPSTA